MGALELVQIFFFTYQNLSSVICETYYAKQRKTAALVEALKGTQATVKLPTITLNPRTTLEFWKHIKTTDVGNPVKASFHSIPTGTSRKI